MNYVASGGETRKELAAVCHFPEDNQELLAGLTKLRGQLHAGPKRGRVDMRMANSMWLDETYADFREDYQRMVQEAFAAPLHRVNFAQRDAVSTEINRWIAGKTRGKIQQGVTPEDFDSRSGGGVIDEPGMVSVNAIFFKADWASRFDAEASRKLPFHVDASREVEAMMMHQSSLLNYAENERAKFLEIHHNAWIEVGEKGVEAAAATATVNRSFGCSAAPVPAAASFHADHPFVFAIVHKPSGSMLFGGWLSIPT